MNYVIIEILCESEQRYDFVYDDLAKSKVKLFGSYKAARDYAIQNVGSDKSRVAPLIDDIDKYSSVVVQRRP